MVHFLAELEHFLIAYWLYSFPLAIIAGIVGFLIGAVSKDILEGLASGSSGGSGSYGGSWSSGGGSHSSGFSGGGGSFGGGGASGGW